MSSNGHGHERGDEVVALPSPRTVGRGASRAGTVLRLLCFLTAAANIGGNAALMFVHEPVFRWLGLPQPADLYTFTAVLGFSFTSGVVALLVALRPAQAVPLLIVGMVGKGLFALVTLAFHLRSPLPWPWLAFGAWDAAFVGVFWLYLVHLSRPELLVLNSGTIVAGGDRPRTRKALLLYYSLSGNARGAIARVEAGLRSKGYECTAVPIVPVERTLFAFPFASVWGFTRILLRAILRQRAAIEPIAVGPDHDHDLVVIAGQTWMVGLSAPVEELFLDARTRHIFEGRDVALVNVSRGLWRRSQAMLASHVQAAGGHLIAASAHTNHGIEPFRTLSLFVYLGFGGKVPAWVPRWLRASQSLHPSVETALEQLGERLAVRSRVLLSAEVLARLSALDDRFARLPRRITEDTWETMVSPVVQPAVSARGSAPEVSA